MTMQQISEWVRLGARLAQVAPEKFDDIVEAIRGAVDTQETIAGFDWQLWLTGKRPNKIYEA
jgi:hypothetical protein